MVDSKENLEKEIKEEKKEEKKIEDVVKSLKIVSWSALVIGILAIIVGILAIVSLPKTSAPTSVTSVAPVTTISNVSFSKAIYVNGSLITPSMSLPDAPVITQNQSFGSRLTNINEPLNASELAIINNASDSYFEQAGLMLLNGSIDSVGTQTQKAPLLIVNGKP
ncbi:MAG: hypothetical protein RXR32_01000, partial [Candidatus Micrarchaeota archaeon]